MAKKSRKENEAASSFRAIHELFETQAERVPDAVALELAGKKLTYSELERRSNQLAAYLRGRGISRNAFVIIFMERSVEMITAILGILKSGAAYVPIDPEYPEERLRFLISDIQAKSVLTQESLAGRLSVLQAKDVFRIDSDWKMLAASSQDRLPLVNDPEDAAYMIYTSGSTGNPKGCPNTHRGILNCVQALLKQFPPTARPLHKSPTTFDTSVPEILVPLSSGSTLVIAEHGKQRDAAYLLSLVKTSAATEIKFVPSMLQMFLDEPGVGKCASLQRVVSAGEALSVPLVKKFYEKLPQAKLVNLYGPTEAAVDVTYWECKASDSVVPIGYPLANNRIYVLDESEKPVAQGEWGELCIGGPQVAKGYWNNDEQTRLRFKPDPFSSDAGARLYKTGDQARVLSDGAIEFRGRIDFQVKIRGFRVEPQEIESVLQNHSGIAQVAVVAKKLNEETASDSLVAYYTAKPSANPSSDELKSFLRPKLPEYMLPSLFVKIAAMPLNMNGKIDRKELSARVEEGGAVQAQASFAPTPAPADPIEREIMAAWRKTLTASVIQPNDNYFALGGDSLSLIRVLRELKEQDFPIEMGDLYSNQTVAELASFIRLKMGTAKKAA